MKEYIAYCGLDCEKCEARLATVNNDDVKRAQVARLWSELNNADITPDMINCEGCRVDGVKTPFCAIMCEIRQCALGRGVETCGDCAELTACAKVSAIIADNADARRNLMG